MSVSLGDLIEYFDEEMEATGRLLARLPEEGLDWRPHDRSMSLGRLAAHLASIPGWTRMVLRQNSFDMEPLNLDDYEPPPAGTIQHLFKANVGAARRLLAAASDEDLSQPWTLSSGGRTLYTRPRREVIRSMLLGHVIHHRGQLTVYLRLRGVPLPPLYGPTADEGIL